MTATIAVSSWRSRIQDDIPDAYNHVVDRAVLDTCIEFCKNTRIWHTRMTPMTSIANVPNYKIRVPASTRLASILELRYAGQKLHPVIDSDLDASTPNWEAKTGTPRQYTMLDQSTARLIGIPIEGVTNALTGSIAIKPERDATEVGEVLWDDWAEAITHGAKYRLFSMSNKAWTDDSKASMHYNQYQALENKAKSIGSNRHTNRARRRVRPFYM